MSEQSELPLFDADDRIGRFVVARRLGAGGMGTVYEARDPELSRSVAIKVLRDRGGNTMRLLREAQALARLAHPNVVGVHEVGSHDGQVFVAMELVDGVTLDRHLAGRDRTWREVLAAFVPAGRGLAAVHAEGLVHRDVKPSNILVDQRGRVRLGDFGLARHDGDGASASTPRARTPASPPVSSADTTLTASNTGVASATAAIDSTVDAGGASPSPTPATPDGLLASPLTAAGAVVGTPRYMAPEQAAGETVTRAADQFSYCVALWEALHRDRAFQHGVALASDLAAGGKRPASSRRVPGWLERAVERGLAVDPAARWPSMDALCDELERAPARRQRLATAAAGLVVLAGVTAAVFVLVPGRGGVDCAQAGAEIAGAWSPALRPGLARTFASARPYGADVAGRVADGLDAYVHAWRDARIDACRANHERGEESAAMLDRRAACLDRGRGAVHALVSRLETADGNAVDRAIDAVAALPDVAACRADRLGATAAPSRDPRAAAIRARLADARAAFDLGHLADARAAATRALADVRELDDPALLAEALFEHGRLTIEQDRTGGASDLGDAMTQAARAHVPEIEAGAAYYLFDAAVEDDDATRADALLPVAHAAIARAGRSRYAIDVEASEAQLLQDRGKTDESLAVCDRIAALAPPDKRDRVAECRCTANLKGKRYQAAVAPCKDDLDATTWRYGADHVYTAVALHNLANLYGDLGDYATELTLGRRALAIYRKAYGDSARTALELADEADTIMRLHRYDEALPPAQEALAMLDRLGDKPTYDKAIVHSRLGQILKHLRRLDEAIPHLEAAAHLIESVGGPDDRGLPMALAGLGEGYLAANRPADALTAFHRARTLSAKAYGATSRTAVTMAIEEATALDDLHRPKEAIPLAQHVLAVATDTHLSSLEVAYDQVALGRALLATGDRAQGRRLLTQARAAYAAAGDSQDVADVDKMLGR